MKVAITGTPGTGKSLVGRELARLGFDIVDLSDLAFRAGLARRPPRRGAPAVVDIEKLGKLRLPGRRLLFMISHFAHLLKADKVIVLRCSPKVLGKRLERRGWREEKIRENAEAEAIDLITVEAMERHRNVYEIDTTKIGPRKVALQIIEIVGGAVKGHEPGRIDWSQEILSWY